MDNMPEDKDPATKADVTFLRKEIGTVEFRLAAGIVENSSRITKLGEDMAAQIGGLRSDMFGKIDSLSSSRLARQDH